MTITAINSSVQSQSRKIKNKKRSWHRVYFLVSLFVIAEADVVAGLGEGIPGDMELGGAGEELVGEIVGFKEVDEALELGGVFRTDVGSLAKEVLGIAHTADFAVDGLTSEA